MVDGGPAAVEDVALRTGGGIMPCGPTTGQCFDYPPPGTTCGSSVSEEGQCPTCCFPFSYVFGFGEESTAGRLNGCFVGIHQEGNAEAHEIRDGRWCSFGCTGSDAADFMDQADNLMADVSDNRNGKRWMKPWQEPFNARGRDAFGMFHDLRSNHYHPVPWHTEWTRGVCWFNQQGAEETGRECFDDDVCKCWRKGSYFDHSPQGGSPCVDFQTGDVTRSTSMTPCRLSCRTTRSELATAGRRESSRAAGTSAVTNGTAAASRIPVSAIPECGTRRFSQLHPWAGPAVWSSPSRGLFMRHITQCTRMRWPTALPELRSPMWPVKRRSGRRRGMCNPGGRCTTTKAPAGSPSTGF